LSSRPPQRHARPGGWLPDLYKVAPRPWAVNNATSKYPGSGGLGHLTDEIAGLLERS
jgi:hypothetical protein